MKTLALAVVLALVAGGQCATHCLWGPSYWCQSKSNAEECGQMKYCMDTLWEKPIDTVSRPENFKCTLCTEVVDYIADRMSSSTEAEVKAGVLKLCDATGPLKSLCQDFVNLEFGPLWKIVVTEGKDKACQEIGLCAGSEPLAALSLLLKTQPKSVPVSNPESFDCDLCTVLAKFSAAELEKNVTEEAVKSAILQQLCNNAGFLAGLCTDFVNQEFDALWKAVVDGGKDKACQEIGLCAGSQQPRAPLPLLLKSSAPAQPEGLECDICTALTNFIAGELVKNATEAEVEAAILEFCNESGPLAGLCTDFVNKEFVPLWNDIINDGAGEACKELGVCTSSKPLLSKKSVPRPLLVETKFPGSCSLCELVAKELINLVETNTTEIEAKVELKKVCVYAGGLAAECRSLIDLVFDELWTAATKEVNATVICQKISMCSSSSSRLSLMAKVKGDSEICKVCRMVVEGIKPEVDKNNSEADVKKLVEVICSGLHLLPGNLSAECDKFVKDDFALLWTVLKTEVDTGDACRLMTLCTSSEVILSQSQPRPLKAAKEAPSDTACDVCTLAVAFIKPYVDNNSTEAEIKAALVTVCGLLPGDIGKECNDTVNTYFDVIWKMLKDEVDSGMICQQLGLCNSTNSTKTFLKQQPRPLKAAPALKEAPSDTACDVCTLAVAFIKPYVDSNSTEAEIKADVEALCGLLPGDLAKECNDTVDMYFDLIWTLLKAEVDGGMICQQIGLCNSTKTFLKVNLKTSEAGLCDLCKMVVGFLRPIVDNKSTEDEAKVLVEKVCNEAGPMKDQCDALVDQFLPMIFKLLQSYLDDDQICAEIKLCKTTSKVAVIEVQKPKVNAEGGILCMLCELVIKELTSMLDTNATKQEIVDALDEVCSKLPSSFKNDCTIFVDKYGPEIIDLILSGTAAKAVCTVLHMCLFKEEALVAVEGVEECELCKTVLDLAKTAIGSKSLETKVDEVIENVCELAPTGIQSECKTFIETFGPELIQLLDSAIDPQKICSMIKLCTTNQVVAGMPLA